MTLTVEQAKDAVLELVHGAWTATGAATEQVPLHFDDVKADAPGELGSTGRAAPYAIAGAQILSSRQSTQGRRRFLSTGIVSVRIFTAFGDGRKLADGLARVVTSALRQHVGSAGGLWFFDVVPVEAAEGSPGGVPTQTNVTANFRFQEVP